MVICSEPGRFLQSFVPEESRKGGNPMNEMLRILNLEDNVDDSELIRLKLAGAGLACDMLRVERKDDFIRALDEERPDLILADYTLPAFDGMTALAITRGKNADLPFIFVTGTMGEDIAIEAVKGGATDFVLKSNLERLTPAVRRALREQRERNERRRAEEELKSSARVWNDTFDAINDAICVMDAQGTILRSNKAMIGLSDCMPQEIAAHPCWETVHRTNERINGCPFQKMLKSRKRESVTIQQSGRWLQIITDPLFDREGRLAGCVHIMSDITEQKLAQEQLRESESKFHSLAEQTLVGAYIVQDGRYRYVNPRFAELFGYTAGEIVDRMGELDLVLADDRHIVAAQREKLGTGGAGSGHSHYEARGVTKKGELIDMEVFSSAVNLQGKPAIIGVVLNTTEKKKLESQLLQSQKMEAVGQLTGGIAHDFNNILSAIISYASLAQMKAERGSVLRSYMDQILAASDRAATLTRSLLTFSRKRTTALQPTDINDCIRRVTSLLQKIIGEDIELRVDAPGELRVNADAGQIEQVLMNLATNARDAMQDGGVLTIRTGLGAADGAGDGDDHGCAVISVTDTGVGVDEKTKTKIFEPFYTTKGPGHGTGLGLSMVYGIISQHNGSIQCSSDPGRGTTFRICLPLLPGAVGQPTAAADVFADENALRGTETILVAEDDEMIRTLEKATLEDFGYTVVTAVDGRDAVDRFREHRDAVSLVLCDVIMPRMNGHEVRVAVRKEKPGMPVLFMSGYPADIIEQKSLLEGGEEIMMKPFAPSLLLKKVRAALDNTHG